MFPARLSMFLSARKGYVFILTNIQQCNHEYTYPGETGGIVGDDPPVGVGRQSRQGHDLVESQRPVVELLVVL